MVDRTNRFGDIVEKEGEPKEEAINVKPFGNPLLLIFLEDNKELFEKLSTLPKVFHCHYKEVKLFIGNSFHITTLVPNSTIFDGTSEVELFVGGLMSMGQELAICLINLRGDIKLPTDCYKLDFDGKSDKFIYEYLKEFLRVV